MRLHQCAPGDVVEIRGGFVYAPADETATVRVSYPIAGGIGVTRLCAFTLEPEPYGFAIAEKQTEVIEVIEKTKWPKVGRDRSSDKAEDPIDPLRLRAADLANGGAK